MSGNSVVHLKQFPYCYEPIKRFMIEISSEFGDGTRAAAVNFDRSKSNENIRRIQQFLPSHRMAES